MKISFKESQDKLSMKIYLDDMFIGSVALELGSQKWGMNPAFSYRSMMFLWNEAQQKHDSAYEAGKALVKLYRQAYRTADLDDDEDAFNLDEILSFLRTAI